MTKVRVEHEDIFIRNVSMTEDILEYYHFDFDSKWVSKDSPTKRITVRKIEVFPMSIIGVASFSFDNPNQQDTRFTDLISFTLTDKKTITEYLDYLVRRMNEDVMLYYPNNINPVAYMYRNSNLSIITSIPQGIINARIIFQHHAIRILNITRDMMTQSYVNPSNLVPLLVSLGPGQIQSETTLPIILDIESGPGNNDGHDIYFEKAWDRIKLFFHASFSTGIKYNYACEAGESYHKLAKKYPMLYESFDIWFTTDGRKVFTSEIDSFVLELIFKE